MSFFRNFITSQTDSQNEVHAESQLRLEIQRDIPRTMPEHPKFSSEQVYFVMFYFICYALLLVFHGIVSHTPVKINWNIMATYPLWVNLFTKYQSSQMTTWKSNKTSDVWKLNLCKTLGLSNVVNDCQKKIGEGNPTSIWLP